MLRDFLRWCAELCIGAEAAAQIHAERRTTKIGIVPHAAEELWTSADGRQTKIGEMEEAHCRHALAMIMRQLRNNNVAYLTDNNRVAFAPVMRGLVDDEIAWQDPKTNAISYTIRKGVKP